MFFKERKLSGDFISKASDIFWQTDVKQFVDADAVEPAETSQETGQVQWVFNVPIFFLVFTQYRKSTFFARLHEFEVEDNIMNWLIVWHNTPKISVSPQSF